MAGSFSLKVDGLDKLLNRLQAKSETIKEDADAIMEGATWNTVEWAKRDVPKDNGGGGGLSGATSFHKEKDLTYPVTVQKYWAPYVEFGTGTHAANYLSSQDSDLRAYAMQFYINGKGRMKPRPFLFANARKAFEQAIKELKELIQK